MVKGMSITVTASFQRKKEKKTQPAKTRNYEAAGYLSWFSCDGILEMASILLLRAVWMAVLLGNAVTMVRSIPSRELDSMLDTLRVRGYDLFCNAIVTSDLRIDLLSFEDATPNANETHSFTFFAPTDASLFALDMTQTASSYTDTLRFHIVPRRLSLAELRLLPDGYMLPTLLSTRRLHVTRRRNSSVTAVGGVDVAFPALFYGRHVAVHGLGGILNLRSINPPPLAPVHPPIRSLDHRYFSPRSSPHSQENQTVLGHVPKSVPFNVTGRRGTRPPVEDPAPEPAQAPENGKVDAPEPQPDWTVHPRVNLSNAPFVAPAVSPLGDPESGISLPPEGYSDAAVPEPVGLELLVRKKHRVSLMETEEVVEMPEKSEPLDGARNCESEAVGLKDHISDDHVRHMQCYAA